MARNLLKQYLPSTDSIKNNKALHFLGDVLHDPNLFHLNRYSVSVALFWGLFIAFIPTPGQMPLAAFAAIYFRANLPLACALTWITNPLTTPFICYLAYTLGRLILHMEPIVFDAHLEMSWSWISHEFERLWFPFFLPLALGSIITGLVFGVLGYFGMQFFWHWSVRRAWEKRKRTRAARQSNIK